MVLLLLKVTAPPAAESVISIVVKTLFPAVVTVSRLGVAPATRTLSLFDPVHELPGLSVNV